MLKSRVAPIVVLLACVSVAACSSEEDPAEVVARGDQYVSEGKLPEAIVEYRRAVSLDPRLGDARKKLAEAYEDAENLRAAYPEFIRAADLLPDDMDLQLKAGQLLLATGRYEDAKTRAQSVLSREPDNVDAQILRGNATAGMKDLSGAISDIEEAIRMAPNDERAYAQLGVMKMATGAATEAEDAFLQAVAVNPKSVDAQLALASFYWASGRQEEAEGPLRQGLRLEPDHLQAQRALATYLRASGRAAEAEAPLKKVVELADDIPSRLALADYYIAQNRIEDTRPILQQVLEAEGGRSPATLRQAAIAYAEGRQEEAHAQIDAVLADNPKDLEMLQLKGRLLLIEGKLDEALARAKTSVTENPDSAPAHFLAASIYQARQDPDSAIAHYTEVLKLNPRASGAQLQLAQLNMARGQANAAVDFAEQASRNSGDNPLAKQVLIRTLAASGQLALASSELDKLIEQFPKVATLRADAARIALLKGDRAAARRAFETAQQLDPNSREAVSGLVALAIADRNLTQARGLVSPMLAKAPNDPQLLFVSSVIHAASGNPKEQESDLRKVLDADPNNMAAYDALATLFIRTGRLEEAKKEYSTIWERQPKSVAAPTMIALLYEAERNQEEARKLYEQILAIDPNSPVAANNLAWLMAETGGNLDVALQLAQTAVQQMPNVPQVNDTLGWVYYKKDLPQMAVTAFEQSVEQDPNNAGYRYHLGLAHQKAGNFGQAKAAFQAAVKADPKHEEARAALTKMGG